MNLARGFAPKTLLGLCPRSHGGLRPFDPSLGHLRVIASRSLLVVSSISKNYSNKLLRTYAILRYYSLVIFLNLK